MDVFVYDQRLGINIPTDTLNWSSFTTEEKEEILMHWETIRGMIPDRIKELETIINAKQEQLNNETSFPISCQLNSEIADTASIINDLWLWYRVQQNVETKMHQ